MARVALLLLLVLVAWAWSGVEAQGYWDVVVPDAGIASMHSAVTHYGNVVLLDRTNIGDSQLPLPAGVCRDNPLDRVRHTMSTPKNLPSIRHLLLALVFGHHIRIHVAHVNIC
jgi:hypothetical protein